MEGPDTPIPEEARVKTYPVREHRGAIWLFVGDMEAVPLAEDLPECLADTDAWHTISTWRTYRCNWRVLNDNLCYDLHAPFVHRSSPELVLAAGLPLRQSDRGDRDSRMARASATPRATASPGPRFPGLGDPFPPPREAFWRKLKPRGRGKELDPETAQATRRYGIRYRHMSRLPAVTLVGRPAGDYFMCRWVTPVDAGDDAVLFVQRVPPA